MKKPHPIGLSGIHKAIDSELKRKREQKAVALIAMASTAVMMALASQAHSETLNYSCNGKRVKIVAEKQTLDLDGKTYRLSVREDCFGWHAEGDGSSFDFCTKEKASIVGQAECSFEPAADALPICVWECPAR
jgi:hypothetical protein